MPHVLASIYDIDISCSFYRHYMRLRGYFCHKFIEHSSNEEYFRLSSYIPTRSCFCNFQLICCNLPSINTDCCGHYVLRITVEISQILPVWGWKLHLLRKTLRFSSAKTSLRHRPTPSLTFFRAVTGTQEAFWILEVFVRLFSYLKPQYDGHHGQSPPSVPYVKALFGRFACTTLSQISSASLGSGGLGFLADNY